MLSTFNWHWVTLSLDFCVMHTCFVHFSAFIWTLSGCEMYKFPKYLILIIFIGSYRLFFTFLLPDWKGKETPCELVETLLWVKRFYGSTLKMLTKEANILMFLTCNIYMYITNCRQYCFGLLGLISAVLMLGWKRINMVSPNDPTLVVPSKPCQSAQTRKKLVSMRNANSNGSS